MVAANALTEAARKVPQREIADRLREAGMAAEINLAHLSHLELSGLELKRKPQATRSGGHSTP